MIKINPWFFYLAEVSETARIIAVIVGIVGLIMLFYDFLFYVEIMKDKAVGEMIFFLTYAAIIISGAILLIFPTKQTVYRMIIVDGLTSENLEQDLDYKEVVDYIIGVTKGE